MQKLLEKFFSLIDDIDEEILSIIMQIPMLAMKFPAFLTLWSEVEERVSINGNPAIIIPVGRMYPGTLLYLDIGEDGIIWLCIDCPGALFVLQANKQNFARQFYYELMERIQKNNQFKPDQK